MRDHREHMLSKLPNVEVFRESAHRRDDIVDFGADHVVLATGSHWRQDGIGVGAAKMPQAFTAALDAGRRFRAPVTGPIVIFDDDHYFMGGALAEKLRAGGP